METLAPPSAPPRRMSALPRRPWPRVWWLLGPVMVLLVIAIVVGSIIRVPYVALSPGSARPVQPLLHLPKGKAFSDRGDVLLLTVRVRRRPTGIEALLGWLQSDTDVPPEKDVYGSEKPATTERVDRTAMSDSKTRAAVVAFEKLGYHVVSGTGVVVGGVADGLPVTGKLTKGDVITAVDGVPTTTYQALTTAIRSRQPGETVALLVERNGKTPAANVPVTLSRNAATGKTIIGITNISTRASGVHFPFKVNFDTGSVVGPSGGLSFTLALLDRLTPGSITGGKRVAVTGEISEDGQVLPIGGVGQKVLAAEHAGADAMIVPVADYPEAAAHASKKLRLFKVTDLDGALKALTSLGGNASSLPRAGP